MKLSLTGWILAGAIVLISPIDNAHADGYVYTPGHPMKYISSTGYGYNVYDLGGGGTTVVQHLDPTTTMVRHGGESPTFIHSDPGTSIEPVLPIGPDLGMEIESFE